MDWIRATYGFRLVAEDLAEPQVLLVLLHRDVHDNFQRFFSWRSTTSVVLCVPVCPGSARTNQCSACSLPGCCASCSRPIQPSATPQDTSQRCSTLFVASLASVGGSGVSSAGYVASALLSPITCGGCGSSTGSERQLLLRDDAGVDGDAERAVRAVGGSRGREHFRLAKKS